MNFLNVCVYIYIYIYINIIEQEVSVKCFLICLLLSTNWLWFQFDKQSFLKKKVSKLHGYHVDTRQHLGVDGVTAVSIWNIM